MTTFAGVLLLAGSAGAADWRVPGDFPTIQQAIDSASVQDGDAILVDPGEHAGATVTKAVAIRARGTVQIVDGPVVSSFGKAGFYFPGTGQGSGASITGLTFDRIPLPIFSRGANDVTVSENTMTFFLQGVTNWGYGSWDNRWEISDNTMQQPMTDCGGGIGVLVGDFEGGTVSGNLVARNSIRGVLRLADDECGGYNAPGIVLYADFRGGATGAVIQGNLVTKNRVILKAKTSVLRGDPWLVTVSGIELSDTRDDLMSPLVITGNVFTYNNLRGMEVPFSFNPDTLPGVNTFENNYEAPPSRTPTLLLREARTPKLPGPSPIR
jgi:hypothetical protein